MTFGADLAIGGTEQLAELVALLAWRDFAPLPGETLALDPRMANGNQEYQFEIRDPGQRVRQVDWFLDGRLLARTGGVTRVWRMQRGTHRLSAKVWLMAEPQPVLVGPVDFNVE